MNIQRIKYLILSFKEFYSSIKKSHQYNLEINLCLKMV